MYSWLRDWTLKVLKTPPEPRPPLGDPASLRVFHAGRNYFRLRMAGWAVAQVVALGAFIFWTVFLIGVEKAAREQGEARANKVAAAQVEPSQTTQPANGAERAEGAGVREGLKETAKVAEGGKQRRETWKSRLRDTVRKAAREQDAAGVKSKQVKGFKTGWAWFKQVCVEMALIMPAGGFALIWAVKILSGLTYLLQIPVTYAVRRLDYEMRWYMVTDRSLRLRQGVWKISESTMSFANIQQVVVSQGPVQRLLGLADVKVKSAGGGDEDSKHAMPDMHSGLFHSVTNGNEIRDLILEQLRRFREAGLGDPDEKTSEGGMNAAGPIVATPAALAAARELVAEARGLRAVLRGRVCDGGRAPARPDNSVGWVEKSQ